ncbi:MAG: carboxypeptidase regulatory-like domain-containing protein, partial [Bullifex sp.]|nr:carboxypeptidase regulatory-like domain-containing protein [Bullifex sp.]
ENEGDVTISFDGVASIPAVTTSANGEFSFNHIPVGSYVMRFRRTDCSDITVPVEVKATDLIDLGIVTITPNTATIKGTVVLKEGLSSEGVTVSIDMGGKTLQTTTDSSGRYEIGGVSIADEYTVTYSKEGWNADSQSIYPSLNPIEIREMPEIALMDTTAPVLKSVTINNGSNTAADRNVKLRIEAEDNGSGISNMLVYDYSNPQFLGTFSSLKDWTFESQNGSKTVFVKVIDRAGNESNVVSAQVNLTDQKKEVKGVLKGEDLTWTKEMSPYLVTGNLLVEKDDTLTIKPGVDIQFSGDYYLQVEGKLSAIGTERERISIYGIDGGANNWDGIKFINENKNIISYTDIDGLKNGIVGYCDIDHAHIVANGWAIGDYSSYSPDDCLRGSLTDSSVKGNVSVAYNTVRRNSIEGSTVFIYDSPIVADNTIVGSTYIEASNADGNIFEGLTLTTKYSFVYNNEVNTATVHSFGDFLNYITYNGSDIYLGYLNYSLEASSLHNIQFNNCRFVKFAADINNSNFIGCDSITVELDRTTRERFDCTGNYWGDINTSEIIEKAGDFNLSFIKDYYDDFNLTKVDYSGYRKTKIDRVGYQGEELNSGDSPSVYKIGDKGPAGGLVFFDKSFYSDGWRYLEAAPSDIGGYAFGYYRPQGVNDCVGMTSVAVGSGKYNTARLVEYMDIDGKAYSNYLGETTYSEYAAKKCVDYTCGGYDDWFLPSIGELHLMYNNLHLKGLGSFTSHDYWSSSERDKDYAWIQFFFYHENYNSASRNGIYSVRPVRAF